MGKFNAGDVIRYPSGRLDYLVSIPGEEGLWVNAVNPSWIDRGLRDFCDECYPFYENGWDKDAEVVGHFGNGDCASARSWYAENKEEYRTPR